MSSSKSRPSPQTNKYGLPYVPATPSTHASTIYSNSSSGGSSSRRSSTGTGFIQKQSYSEEYDDDGYDREHQLQQELPQKQRSWNEHDVNDEELYQKHPNYHKSSRETHRASGDLRQSESNQQLQQHQKRTAVATSLSSTNGENYRTTKGMESQQQQKHNKSLYTSSQHSPSIVGETTVLTQSSQSTSSTSSSRKQLLLPHTAKSSNYSLDISNIGDNNSYQNHNINREYRQRQEFQQPEPDEPSIQIDEDDETINTLPMIAYNLGGKHPRNIHQQSKSNADDAPTQFLDESFASIDFGSVNGIAPMANQLPTLDLPHEQQIYLNTINKHEKDVEEDEAMLYYNDDNGNMLYDDDRQYNYADEQQQYYDEEHNAYNDGFPQQETEEMYRAVKRGSALATTGPRNLDAPDPLTMYEHNTFDHRDRLSSRGQLRPPTQPTLAPLRQHQSAATRRPQISRSMSSKRHLLAASARGVKVNNINISSTPYANENTESNNMMVEPIPYRGNATNVGSKNDVDTYRMTALSIKNQQPQQHRGSVTKSASYGAMVHNNNIPPQQQHQRRSSSLRHSNSTSKELNGRIAGSDYQKDTSISSSLNDRQQQRQHGYIQDRAVKSYDDIPFDPSKATLNEQIRQHRGSVNKAHSHNDIERTKTSSLPRGSVTKLPSHNDIDRVVTSKQASRGGTRRSSSIRGDTFDAKAVSSQPHSSQPHYHKQNYDNSCGKTGGIHSYNHDNQFIDEDLHQQQHRERKNITKSASYNVDISPRKVHRNSVVKASSHNGEFNVPPAQQDRNQDGNRGQFDVPTQPAPPSSRRRSSLEHVPTATRQTHIQQRQPSLRRNSSNMNTTSQRTMHQLPRSRSFDYDDEFGNEYRGEYHDQNNMCNVEQQGSTSRKVLVRSSQSKVNLSSRRMSAGHIPQSHYMQDKSGNNIYAATSSFALGQEPMKMTRSKSQSEIAAMDFVDDDGNDYSDEGDTCTNENNLFEMSFSDLAARRR